MRIRSDSESSCVHVHTIIGNKMGSDFNRQRYVASL